jgi:death-on-curing protein
MLFLTLEQVIALHELIVSEIGGSHGTRNLGAIESALAQPRQTFGGAELYPTLEEKAAVLGFSLISNHPFVDGNKRIGLAATVALLRANGRDLNGSVDEQERIVLAVASGEVNREAWTIWVREHARPFS